jgi:hypothetical protein
MARVNIADNETIDRLGLIASLRSGVGLSENKIFLDNELKKLGFEDKYNLDKKEDREKLANFLETADIKTNEEVVEEIDNELASKLDKMKLDELVRLYEENQSKAVEIRIANRVGIKPNQVQVFIRRQKEIVGELLKKGINPKETNADEIIAKSEVIIEEKLGLKESKITPNPSLKKEGDINPKIEQVIKERREIILNQEISAELVKPKDLKPKSKELGEILKLKEFDIKKEIAVVVTEKEIVRKSEIATEKIDKLLNEEPLSESEKKEIKEFIKKEIKEAYYEPVSNILENKGERFVRKIEEIVPENKRSGIEKSSFRQIGDEIQTSVISDVEKKTEVVELARKANLETRIVDSLLGENLNVKEVLDAKNSVLELLYPETVSKVAEFENQAFLEAEGMGAHPTKEQWFETKTIANIVNGKNKVEKLLGDFGRAKNILKKVEDKIPEVRAVSKVMETLEKNKQLASMYEGVRKIVGITNKVGGVQGRIIGGLGRLIGNETLKNYGLSLANRIGGQAMAEFATQSLAVISESGSVSKGLFTIAKGILSGGVKAAATGGEAAATGATAAGSTALTSAVAAFQAIPLVGQIILVVAAVAVVASSAIKKIKKGFTKLYNALQKVGLEPPDFRKDLGGFLGTIANVAGGVALGVGGMLMAIPAMLMGLSVAVWPVVVPLLIGVLIYSTLQTNQVSTFVPPVGIGGGCVKKEDLLVSGEINCNQNLSMQSVSGVDRDNYFSLADRWVSGKNYARECFDAVVCESRSKGVNPIWSLYAWLHESGASNYNVTPGETEDFGIHFIPENENFQAQIEAFLKIEPGSNCSGGDYWLNLATNYLTGGCDPDAPNPVSGETGRDYLEGIKLVWEWIAPGTPLPSSIKISPTGEDCGGGSVTSPETIGFEFTDENGDVWVCEEDPSKSGNYSNIDFPDWDVNTPVPEGCPDMLPTSGGYFTQGPFAGGCSHSAMTVPAIDIGIGGGSAIYATHPGVVEQGYNDIYGFYVDLHGKCNGKDFFTRSAHMPDGGFKTSNGATVQKGDIIGVVDTTGSSTGDHIHYDIRGLETERFGQYLGLSVETTKKLWGCCGSWNGIMCP